MRPQTKSSRPTDQCGLTWGLPAALHSSDSSPRTLCSIWSRTARNPSSGRSFGAGKLRSNEAASTDHSADVAAAQGDHHVEVLRGQLLQTFRAMIRQVDPNFLHDSDRPGVDEAGWPDAGAPGLDAFPPKWRECLGHLAAATVLDAHEQDPALLDGGFLFLILPSSTAPRTRHGTTSGVHGARSPAGVGRAIPRRSSGARPRRSPSAGSAARDAGCPCCLPTSTASCAGHPRG